MKERMINLANKFRLIVLSMPFVAACIISCSEREAYYKFQELEAGNWPVHKVLLFEIDSFAVDSNVPYDISIEITNNVDYPYQNFWLFSEYSKDDSTTIKNEYEFILADEFGKWKGAGFASLYQTSHTVMKSVVFDKKKEHTIFMRHGMQDNVLHGIEKVGIKVTRSK